MAERPKHRSSNGRSRSALSIQNRLPAHPGKHKSGLHIRATQMMNGENNGARHVFELRANGKEHPTSEAAEEIYTFRLLERLFSFSDLPTATDPAASHDGPQSEEVDRGDSEESDLAPSFSPSGSCKASPAASTGGTGCTASPSRSFSMQGSGASAAPSSSGCTCTSSPATPDDAGAATFFSGLGLT